ncbi:disease resistance protein RGA2-like isoform X2 [Silene latifolia]|uniref:disease resistance protein RGA2-like isoform X2 n=1 Tax=Silene latifolia TaxID=37657 RepID=UPI003D7786B0
MAVIMSLRTRICLLNSRALQWLSLLVCSHSQRDVVEKLERAHAKLIDFQNAKAAKARQKERMGGTKFIIEVRLFFSPSNQLVSSFKDARTIKRITGELRRIASNHALFGSIISSSTLNQTRTLSNVSRSYMSAHMVIGRDGDRDKMLWVSVTQDFNVKDVLRQMVTCATDEKALDYEIDQLQRRLFKAIAGRRFLLVLDGVWDDDSLRAKWLELRALLRVGAEGSQVLLTTRSETVARIIGTHDPLIVSDLGDDDSLLLFDYVVATEWYEPGVEAIAKEIAKMCPNVPLVIRAIGSLLVGKNTVQEWRAVWNELANSVSYGRDIMGTLKLSYDQLGTRVKPCVLYCSLFPKGFQFEKSMLIRLWIAMGYVEGEYANQSLEEVAEGYVLCLLNRGFFFSNNRDGYKCPDVFQMHNLMHDLVLSIGGYKYKMADSNTNEFDEKVCHVSYHLTEDSSFKVPSSLFKTKQLKSVLLPLPTENLRSYKQVRVFPLEFQSSREFQSLRVLRMHGLGINKLPRSIGKMIHLTYLDFSRNSIHKLPESITQLVNLYLLDLSYCRSLEELPEEISKLVALRHLILYGCNKLSHMPKGLTSLTRLETLNYFVVGKPSNSFTSYKLKAKLACDLADLGYLDNLKGELKIVVVDRSNDLVSGARAVNLDKKEISKFSMIFRESRIEDEMVLENLKPGADLEELTIKNYGGKRLPSWMREGIHCTLPHLTFLKLKKLDKVEYIENGSSCESNYLSTPLFPSLKRLTLRDIPMLKEWWSMTESPQDQGLNHLNQLIKQMTAFPILDNVEMDMELVISLAQEFLQDISSLHTLTVCGKTEVVAEQRCGPSNVVVKQRQPVILKSYLPKLHTLRFYKDQMEHLPEEFRGMSSLESLQIINCEALEALPKWIDSLTSLDILDIQCCPKLKSLPDEMSNLSNLKTLCLEECSSELAERCQSGEDWPKIQHIPNITVIPLNLLIMGNNELNQSSEEP